MKSSQAKQEARTASRKKYASGQLVIERRGSDVFINGYRVLAPSGKGSVSTKKLREAARRVSEAKRSSSR